MLSLRAWTGLAATMGALALAGCGSDDDTATTTAAAGGADAAFPATVEHAFGTTTVPDKPERIVVVGLTEQDTVLALGHTPVATTEWYGEQPNAVWPWARDELGDADPEVLSTDSGFEFERIAVLRPDLIIGTNAGMKRGDYEKLSAIAPTIASPKGATDYFAPWDRQVELIAAALGQPQEGEELVASVRERFAEAAREHPELAGKTATFAQNAFYDGQIYVYPDGLNTEFLTYLGLEINPRITALADQEVEAGQQLGVSAERLRMLEADVVLFATEEAGDIPALERVPTFRTLPAVAEHRAVFTDAVLAGAVYFMSPLSLAYVAERLPPLLAEAVAGEAPRAIATAGGPQS